MKQDIDNLIYVDNNKDVDKLNKKFYEAFSYPWPPMTFQRYIDSDFNTKFLNQDIGFWNHDAFPSSLNLLVAGCGTNQAVFYALKYPDATITATDISETSLDICKKSCDELGIKNVKFCLQNINEYKYDQEFDYVVCTGVIHHNADPDKTLSFLKRALKKEGILELMVYNYYHRFFNSAFQKIVRNISRTSDNVDFEKEIEIASKIIENCPENTKFYPFLKQFAGSPKALLADALIQPIEYSYTVESLDQLCSSNELEIIQPTINQFDKGKNRLDWELSFKDKDLANAYNNTPDTVRWHITNLLLLDNSPMLWFYIKRTDSAHARRSQREVCEDFLSQRFERASTKVKIYQKNKDGKYIDSSNFLNFPSPEEPQDYVSRLVYGNIESAKPMGQILRELNLNLSSYEINKIRILLTTSAFPYLVAAR